MSLLKSVALLLAIVLYFYHVVRRIRRRILLHLWLAIGCIALLALPLDQEPLRIETMASCSAAFMVTLQIYHLFLSTLHANRLSWSFYEFVYFVVRDLIPIVHVDKAKRRGLRKLLRDNFRFTFRSVLDLFVYNTTWMWLVRCLGPGVSFVDQSKLLDVIYSAAFFIHLISGAMFRYHLQHVLFSLITMDRYRVVEFHHEPFLSQSPLDFWSCRWNLQLKNVFKRTIIGPMNRINGKKRINILLAFAISGMGHVYIIWVLFGTRLLHAFIFFIIHGLACAVEKSCSSEQGNGKKVGYSFFNHCAWVVFSTILLPLYFGTFMRSAPQACGAN